MRSLFKIYLTIKFRRLINFIRDNVYKLSKYLPWLSWQERVVKEKFNESYYLLAYPDVRRSGVNPLTHYMSIGWREGRNPSPDFKTISYMICNPDVVSAGINPYYHYIAYGMAEGRRGINEQDALKRFMSPALHCEIQDISFPLFLENAERIMVIVVPEHNTMSGGIFSMFSIANIAHRLSHQHDYEVILMTRPNLPNVTYIRQLNFRNSEDVYRFEQIKRCQNVKELYLHIPEYATTDFVDLLSNDTLDYLKDRDRLYINILNQNIDLMPEAAQFINLRDLADELTQSVAHHAYFSQAVADKYDLPTLLLPAYTDISTYTPTTFDEKEKLIIYSLDYAPHKERCLELIREQLPDYDLLEIRDITFDQYMKFATQCMFSISFGEGFDGYIAQPIHQGGLGFTVYNEEFFPTQEFLKFENFFESEEQMLDQICDKFKYFASNRQAYIDLNVALIDEYDKLYHMDDYITHVSKLISRKFEIYPKDYLPSAKCCVSGSGIYKIN